MKSAYQKEICKIFESHQSRVSKSLCRDCGIEFLTAISNCGRTDLRCPFGCRSKHAAFESNRRSKEYYQSAAGRLKKEKLNQKRSKKEPRRKREKPRPRVVLYYRWLIWAVDGRRFDFAELDEMLRSIFEKMRQHCLVEMENICKVPDS
jgi:hypothetical protein